MNSNSITTLWGRVRTYGMSIWTGIVSGPSDRQWQVRWAGTGRRTVVCLAATSAVALGCGASYPAPTQHLADAQSAERSAAELGAANQPRAQLHLQLAREQIGMANASIRDGDNEKADRMLVRAKSDAELAIALTREEGAKAGAQGASVQSNNQQSVNATKGCSR